MNKTEVMPIEEKIAKAREVYREFCLKGGKFYQKKIENLSVCERRDLVRIFYDKIREIPIAKVPYNQLYAISYEIYEKSGELISKHGRTSEEGNFFEKIEKLEKLSEGYERDKRLEELSIELECSIATEVSSRLNDTIYNLYPDGPDKSVPF